MTSRYKRYGPRLTVSLTGADYERLNTLAAQDDVSVSWVIRRAIEDYLRRRPRAAGGTASSIHRRERRAAQTQ
jgi:predicted transcriptional regulator